MIRWEVFCPFDQTLRFGNSEIGISLQSIQWLTGVTCSPPRGGDWLQDSLNLMKDEIEKKYQPYLGTIEDSKDNNGDNISKLCSQKILNLLQMIQPLLKFKLKCMKSKIKPSFILFQEVLEDISLIQQNLVSSQLDTIWDSPVGQYFIPKNSIFLLDDIRKGLRTCSQISFLHGRYRTIVIDPPWSNKSARRGKVYQTSFENKELIRLGPQLDSLYHPEGCLVAIWVTNNKRIIDFVLNQLLKEWGLSYVDTWWWIKLGVLSQNPFQYQPIFPIHSTHRKPYERVIIASKNLPITNRSLHFNLSKTMHFHHSADAESKGSQSVGNDLGGEKQSSSETESLPGQKRKLSLVEVINPTEKQNPDSSRSVSVDLLATLSAALLSDSVSPQSQPVLFPEIPTEVIVSFPIRHSWKPPLQRLLHQSLSTILRAVGETHQSPQTSAPPELPDHCDLELFARELRSGCTSLGNEVLFHQTV
jgi:hypothetical protein